MYIYCLYMYVYRTQECIHRPLLVSRPKQEPSKTSWLRGQTSTMRKSAGASLVATAVGQTSTDAEESTHAVQLLEYYMYFINQYNDRRSGPPRFLQTHANELSKSLS